MRILSDSEIDGLIMERKPVEGLRLNRLIPKDKPGASHRVNNMDVTGENGSLFTIRTRQSKTNIFDFSIILTYREKGSNKDYTLLRYNGKHPSYHTNRWEKSNGHADFKFEPTFHIHKATQRYQESGFELDGFAKPTTIYSDFASALQSFLFDCNIFEKDDEPRLLL